MFDQVTIDYVLMFVCGWLVGVNVGLLAFVLRRKADKSDKRLEERLEQQKRTEE